MSLNQLLVYEVGDSQWNNLAVPATAGQVLTTAVGAAGLAWATPATGSVTSIAAGTGLTASPSPITSTGTLSITSTGVTAATYTSPLSLTVNAQGQLTAVSSAGVKGTATLASSTVSVANTSVTSSSVVLCTYTGATPSTSTMGSLYTVVTAVTGFTINSNHAADNNTVAYTVFY